MVIVIKKDECMRLWVDYRKLNQCTRFDSYPIPRVDDLLDSTGQATYLTSLDLAKGYWQVPMLEEDQVKTDFVSPFNPFQFTVMSFGLSGAPATFQHLMDQVLWGTESFTGIYLNNTVIYSYTSCNHLSHTEQVLEKLQNAGLTLKLKKCMFRTAECTDWGHQIGRGGVRPEQNKIIAVQQLKCPTTK